ncbi:uncharacterized protein LOC125649848 isoform X2 [Ostrea edulis]|uniref:uncharacterized protein LOC125649848 isoform X2 n=1 Tax=Ostrea edulis TaxID=37623 RepID=UPI0024AFC332|nr:uncharacterized protein LOC125649848 isoform X2 [Ostrea edulis]
MTYIRTKIEMTADLWFIILILLTNNEKIGVLSSESSSCGTILPPLPHDYDHEHKDKFSVSSSLQHNCKIFPRLKDILKQLGIFTLQASLCSELESVTRTTYPSDKLNSLRRISITLDFIEDIPLGLQLSGQDTNMTSPNSCHNMGTFSMDLEPLARLQIKNNQSESQNISTAAQPPSIHSHEEESAGLVHHDLLRDKSLSYTQTVVIATCASIIGTFFLIAGIIRMRNYWKRCREEQTASRRLAYTNCHLPLYSSDAEVNASAKDHGNGSPGSISSQNSSPIKQHDLHERVSNGKSPVLHNHYLDTMPLLVVTAPSTGPNTPSGSVSSIQYIDEESGCNGDDSSKMEKNQEELTSKDCTQAVGSNQNVPNENFAGVDKPTETSGSKLSESNSQSKIQGLAEYVCCEDDDIINVDPHSNQNQQEGKPNISIIHCGISQSDESLATVNHTYYYGNQVEYSSSPGYGLRM